MTPLGTDHLQIGAVALLDVLGARELLASMKPGEYIKALRTIEQEVRARARAYDAFTQIPVGLQTAFFSDTMLICVAGRGEARPEEIVNMVASHVAAAIGTAQDQGRPFMYRGCIAFGEVLMSDHYFVGPAVNEAAEWYEKADAGAVWLLPSAVPHARAAPPLLEWAVPFKDGRRFFTYVVNPLASSWWAGGAIRRPRELKIERFRAARSDILATFDSPRVDVAIKRRHTAELLDAAVASLIDAEPGES